MASFIFNLGARFDDLSDLYLYFTDGENVIGSTINSGFTNLADGVYSLTATVPAGATNAIYGSTAEGEFGVLAVSADGSNAPDESDDEETVSAYLFTKNANGVITGGIVVSYQLIGLDEGSSGAAINSAIQTVTSNDAGLVNIEMVRGAYYRYWIGSGRYRTVHIDADTTDPFPLPDVAG